MKRCIQHIIKDIQKKLKETAPPLTEEQIERRNRILNSDNPNFSGYGHKMGALERLAREIQTSHDCEYEDAVKVFQTLIRSDIHEEKFMAVLFLNRFRRYFNDTIVDLFKKAFTEYCDTWALCDSSMIKVLGLYLAKEGKEKLAITTINEWSNSEDLWVKRASLVIYLKMIMIKKDFDMLYLSGLIEKVKIDTEPYIEKGIAWLIKTCSRYKPEVIFRYLMENRGEFSRLVLRDGSKKLSKAQRAKILGKK